jgi:hypothetical protein
MHTDVAARQGMSRGSTGQFLVELFAAGQQMPVAFFNMMSQGSARATALVQGEPFAKKIDSRQSTFGVVLDPVPKLFNRALVEERVVDGPTIVELLESVSFPVGRGFDSRTPYAQDNASSPHPLLSFAQTHQTGVHGPCR